jgi:RNA polymerase sigma-70 factor, ECF subfamily
MRAGIAGREPATDGRLMDEVSSGNVEAFAELYDRYCHRAYSLAFSVCHDRGRAQDAVQEGFLSVWRSRASYRSHRGPVAAWLLTVVRHRAIDLLRSDERHEARRASVEQLAQRPGLDDVLERTVNRDDGNRLRASLRSLPAAQQEVIVLAFYGQLSHNEIAAALGLPRGTVKGRMRLGLQALRTNIGRAAA